jgi:hypothetical protein
MRRIPLPGLLALVSLLAVFDLATRAPAQTADDDLASRLSLSDLAAYRAALAGRATVDDARGVEPPRIVSFRQLWDASDDWRGRRVQVTGRVARLFHQQAVGSFPPLAEAWLSTPAGDLLCVVFPAERGPEIGETVHFTGTFLKSIRYPAGDQPRLAPLIVGDRPPQPVTASTPVNSSGSEPLAALAPSPPFAPRHALVWALASIAALAAAGLLAWYHLRTTVVIGPRPKKRPGDASSTLSDPRLEFIGPEHEDESALS